MKNKMSVSYRDGLLKILKDPAEAAEYLNTALEEGEMKYFLIALRNVAEAQGGLKKISTKTKLNQTSLYRMLSDSGNPELMSLETLLEAMGFKMSIQPKKHMAGAKA